MSHGTRYRQYISNVVVYREDLDYIYSSFESRKLNVTISDSEFEYNDFTEVLKQRGKHPSDLEISGKVQDSHLSHVTVSFSSNSATVSYWGPDAPKELWHELCDFIKAHRKLRKMISDPYMWFVVTFFAFNVEFLAFMREPLRSETPWWTHAVSICLIAAWPLSYVYSRTLTAVQLTRHNEGGFWSRNRDSIILLIIGTIFGAIATYILTTITKQ